MRCFLSVFLCFRKTFRISIIEKLIQNFFYNSSKALSVPPEKICGFLTLLKSVEIEHWIKMSSMNLLLNFSQHLLNALKNIRIKDLAQNFVVNIIISIFKKKITAAHEMQENISYVEIPLNWIFFV